MPNAVEKRRKELAERIARSLEAGIIPWQKKGLPDSPVRSAVSGRQYEGVNALRLVEACAEKGYKDPRFITASEANQNGVHVRKGEHGTVLEHWVWVKGGDGRILAKGYSVFNVEQLDGRLPIPDLEKSDLQKAFRMLKNAGIDLPEGSGVKECQDAIRKLTVKNAEETGLAQIVHTPELLALRYSIASTMAMRETGIPVEQAEGAPTKSWAQSIKHDPSQLSKAARDGSLLAGAVLADMRQDRDAELAQASLFRANEERAEAQRGQELVSEANAIPGGPGSDLPNAGLSGVQKSVVASAAKAAEQVNDLRASASIREMRVHSGKVAEARDVAKKELGKEAIVTSAQPGHTYQGKIIGVIGDGPDRAAIQAISDNHAILHDIRDIAAKSGIRIGEEVTLVSDEQGYSSVQQAQKANSDQREREQKGLKR